MIFFFPVATGCMAHVAFDLASSSELSVNNAIAESLSAFPNRQTAYKIATQGIQMGVFWAGLNCTVMCASSICWLITGLPNSAANPLPLRIIMTSSTLNFGTFLLSLGALVYARRWEILEGPPAKNKAVTFEN